jgi:molecular chaperone DnaK (HSP70)
MRTFTVAAITCLLACSSKPASLVVEENSPMVGADGTTTESLGVGTFGGAFTPVIVKGTKVPCTWTQPLRPGRATPDLGFSMYRGADPDAAKDHFLGRFQVVGVADPARAVVEVTFAISGRNVTVAARDRTTGKALEVVKAP